VSIEIERGKTLAIVHTHPEEQGQTPSPADRAVARRTGVPVVVLGMKSEKIIAATPDGDVIWLSFFWSGKPSVCKDSK
jgi:proteasome lid subunit RPN8/RPN11